MKPYSGEYSPYKKETFSKPSGKWRKLYQCKVAKGDHEFKLVKPDYSFINLKPEYRDLTALEYYAQEEVKRAGRTDYFSQVLYHYECIHCKKREMNWKREVLPNRRIRKLVSAED